MHISPVKKTPVLPRQCPTLGCDLTLSPSCLSSLQVKHSINFRTSGHRTQELPVTGGSRIGLCLQGRQDGFYGTALVPVAGREPRLSSKSEPRVLAPFFTILPLWPMEASLYFLVQILKCLVFRVEMFITENAILLVTGKHRQRNTYSMDPEWKEWVGKAKTMLVTRYASQGPFLPTWIHSKKVQNPTLLWNVHFRYRNKLNRCFISHVCICVYIKINVPPKHMW